MLPWLTFGTVGPYCFKQKGKESLEIITYTLMNISPETSVTAPVHRFPEGRTATAIERQTAKFPSDTFLWAAGASIALSLSLKLAGRKHDSLFVGQWAPTFLLLGIYNKLVKLFGTDPRRAGPR